MPEFHDPDHVLRSKYEKLYEVISSCNNIVIFTGAGISTAAQIPDFKGDHGLDKAPLNIAQMGISERDLDCKMPTLGHRAISVLLERDTRMKFVVTSNHDGLHQKSGTPWDKTANVFGVAYIEECLQCRTQYIRRTITPALQRICDNPDCCGKLKKTGVRYGQTVPTGPLENAEKAARDADLVLVLGSSMTTYPFCNLPSLSKYIICNRQTTPYDDNAELVIHDDVNNFMSKLLDHVVAEPVNLDFEYKQEFLVKRKGSDVVVTTPRPNEPATFIDSIHLLITDGDVRSFEQRLSGEFTVSTAVFPPIDSVHKIVVEFKAGFDVPPVTVDFKLDEITYGALVKQVKY